MKKSWQQLTMGQVATLFDSLHKTPKYSEAGYPMVRVTDIKGTILKTAGCKAVSRQTFLEFSKKYRPCAGDIVFSRVGSYGNSSFVQTTEDFCLGQNTVCISARRQVILPYFLFAFLLSRDAKSQIDSFVGGASQPTISLENIKRIVVPVPPLPTQQRIAAILSAYEDLIENNTRRIAILEEMARRLYEEWFVHFRFPGHEEVEFDGELPRGWRKAELGRLVEERRDAVQPDAIDPETPYVGLEHIPRRSITQREWSTAATVQSTKLRFVENDILFGKIRPYFHKVSLSPLSGVTSSDTIVLRAISEENLPLALFCASSDDFVDHATQTSNGTKMPRANWSVLRQYPVVSPNSELLVRFNSFLFPLLQNLKSLNRRNNNLRAQRDLLLPKLVSGEIDVRDAEVVSEAAE